MSRHSGTYPIRGVAATFVQATRGMQKLNHVHLLCTRNAARKRPCSTDAHDPPSGSRPLLYRTYVRDGVRARPTRRPKRSTRRDRTRLRQAPWRRRREPVTAAPTPTTVSLPPWGRSSPCPAEAGTGQGCDRQPPRRTTRRPPPSFGAVRGPFCVFWPLAVTIAGAVPSRGT